MKKFLILTLVFINTISSCVAADEIVLDLSSYNQKLAIVEQRVEPLGDTDKQGLIKESEWLSSPTADYESSDEMIQSPIMQAPILQGMSNFFSAQVERTDKPTSLLKNTQQKNLNQVL